MNQDQNKANSSSQAHVVKKAGPGISDEPQFDVDQLEPMILMSASCGGAVEAAGAGESYDAPVDAPEPVSSDTSSLCGINAKPDLILSHLGFQGQCCTAQTAGNRG